MSPVFSPTISAQGAAMPAVGYGTMLFPEPERAVGLVQHALACGYRHIDTARKYGSEQWVGEGIRASGLPREDIWVTTKVTEENARADDFARSVETSLETLGLDHVDLLLFHSRKLSAHSQRPGVTAWRAISAYRISPSRCSMKPLPNAPSPCSPIRSSTTPICVRTACLQPAGNTAC